jgi:hypothetical protein
MPRTGRVSKLTPQVQTAIVQAVTAGVPLRTAAPLAGVSHDTVLEWLARGEGRSARPTTPLYAHFAQTITRAKAIDEARRLARLEQAGRGGAVVHEKITTFADGRQVVERTYAPPEWRCDTWYLEHAFPDRWGRRVQADLSLQIRQIAEEVAKEVGVSADEIIAEAHAFLKEHDLRRR